MPSHIGTKCTTLGESSLESGRSKSARTHRRLSLLKSSSSNTISSGWVYKPSVSREGSREAVGSYQVSSVENKNESRREKGISVYSKHALNRRHISNAKTWPQANIAICSSASEFGHQSFSLLDCRMVYGQIGQRDWPDARLHRCRRKVCGSRAECDTHQMNDAHQLGFLT